MPRTGAVTFEQFSLLVIVSPDSVERDYVHKRVQYRPAGVAEY
jgi:hypothetical protein